MANSLYQWMATYYPTFKHQQMKQAQLHMEQYRQQTLHQQGQAVADPAALLVAGLAPAAAAPPPAVPAPPDELAQQIRVLHQQQAQFQAAVLDRLENLHAGPSAAAAAERGAAVVEREWGWDDDEGADIVVDLSSSASGDYSSADSMLDF